jgi:hypothetical protein
MPSPVSADHRTHHDRVSTQGPIHQCYEGIAGPGNRAEFPGTCLFFHCDSPFFDPFQHGFFQECHRILAEKFVNIFRLPFHERTRPDILRTHEITPIVDITSIVNPRTIPNSAIALTRIIPIMYRDIRTRSPNWACSSLLADLQPSS